MRYLTSSHAVESSKTFTPSCLFKSCAIPLLRAGSCKVCELLCRGRRVWRSWSLIVLRRIWWLIIHIWSWRLLRWRIPKLALLIGLSTRWRSSEWRWFIAARWLVEFSPLCIIFRFLYRIVQDLMCCLDSLKFGDDFYLLAWISIGMELFG